MEELLFARLLMALSLAFHILFACAGVGMPLLMVLAEVQWLRTGDRGWLRVNQAWAKGTAVLFAIGAVSGTVLSFELGLLFPRFLEKAGPVIGLPFALEGYAFFAEAIFLGLYLYGWGRLRPALHLAAGIGVAIAGAASAGFVVIANAWMNAPTGFSVTPDGAFVDVDPLAALATPFAPHEVTHMILAAWMSTALAAAGLHALRLLRAPASDFHRKALRLALFVAIPTTLLQGPVGHLAAQRVAERQPLKLAAMEAHYVTQARAPLRLGGLPDHDAREAPFSLELPALLSVLAFDDPDAVVRGLQDFPRRDWPAPTVHYAFQLMVAIGSFAVLVALRALFLLVRRQEPAADRWLLRALVVLGPAGFVAVEAGWTVTEVGRQPWVIYGVLRTVDAVTPAPNLWLPFALFAVVYAGLGATVVAILRRQLRAADLEAP